MKSFEDNTGRAWSIDLTIGAARRVRDKLDFDLTRLASDAAAVQRLYTDAVLLCDLVYVLCLPQAESRQVDDLAFAESMGGDALDAALEALLAELPNFSRRPQRAALTKLIAKVETVMGLGAERAIRILDSGQVEEATEQELDKLLTSKKEPSTTPSCEISHPPAETETQKPAA